MTDRLCTPIIGGLLSNMSNKVFVSNCVPGATIIVRSLTRPDDLVRAPTTASFGYLPLLPNVQLVAGDRLVAAQLDGAGNESPQTAPELAVVVGGAPTSVQGVSPVDIAGRLWQCGRYAFVPAAIPGATVEVLRNGAVVGAGVADGGIARVALTTAFAVGRPIQVRQRVGGLIGPALTRDVEALPVSDAPLPAPFIVQPLRSCQIAVRIEGVFEGSDVTLTRDSGEVQASPFDLSGLWFQLSKPLDEANGRIRVRQDLPSCRRQGDDAVADVQPPSKPPTPIVYPLCAGMVSVYVDNLDAGADVAISVGSTVYHTVASGAGNNRFDIDPLPAGPITVQSFMCGLGSDLVTTVVASPPAFIDDPVIVGPLVKCQKSVSLKGLKPGATVQVMVVRPDGAEWPISQQQVAPAPAMDIDVTALVEGEAIRAVQWACALIRRESAIETVWPLAAVDDPRFPPQVTRLDRTVSVSATLRDAQVEVFRQINPEQWEMIGRAVAKGPVTSVALWVELRTDDVLQVRQRYCAVQSPGRQTTTVVKPVPKAPDRLAPDNATIAVGSAVTLIWRDPAIGSEPDRVADSFDVTVLAGGQSIVSTTVGTTILPLTSALTTRFAATFAWSVTPRNATGPGPVAHASFKTPPAPTPLIQAVQEQGKIKVTGSRFAADWDVEIAIAVEYHQLLGSPQAPVEFNDNRWGKDMTRAGPLGSFERTFVAAEALEPRTELVGGGSQMIKAPPYRGAKVTIVARNKRPIPSAKGSDSDSNEVILIWA